MSALLDTCSPELDAPVSVVPYDPSWPARFEAERAVLAQVLAPWLAGPIEHIGSTAVPSMPAKDIIDIMAPVHSLQVARGAVDALCAAGYVHHPYKAEVMHWLCKPSPQVRTHHLHLVPRDSWLWLERLCFRDALRRSSALAAQYAELKLRLADEFRFDRESYTDAKAPFVRAVLSASSGVRYFLETQRR